MAVPLTTRVYHYRNRANALDYGGLIMIRCDLCMAFLQFTISMSSSCCFTARIIFRREVFFPVLYGIVWMIKIEDSTVSLQDKTMYFNSPLFLLSHSQPFSKSFPTFFCHSREGGNPPGSTAKYPAGTVAFVQQTGDSCLRRSDGREMKAAGVTW